MAEEKEVKEGLASYLRWLITLDDDAEKVKFKEQGLVDDYIEIEKRIDLMSIRELVGEINNQIAYTGTEVNTAEFAHLL